MEKLVFSQASKELINKELGVIYHGYKGTTIVEISAPSAYTAIL